MNNKKTQKKFSLPSRMQSFTYAFNGLRTVFKEEHNVRIHLVISLLVIASGFLLEISIGEWIMICFAIGFVISIEILNSAIEGLCDFVSPEYHNLIKKVKDISASAVLISSVSSVIVGILIFLPKLGLLINH